ncbi:MAG: 23S rRNA (uracil(747)-C(5))-methyltransferase RlmC [Halothiobacillaceae bacterium]|nr:MAG: 23S rRNA (uracil(747)-C(5))-methyltransferase RlmC [Halothiobacillaceae bacterium]
MITCHHYAAGRCRSCTLIEQPLSEQLRAKQRACLDALSAWPELHWLGPVSGPVSGPEAGFRNKAKMVVSGTADAPVLGILDAQGRGVDLRDCPLYPPAMQAAFDPILDLIRAARLEPYDVPARRGELKYVLLTRCDQSGEMMLRLVLRSRGPIEAIRARLPDLLAALPLLLVVSVNLQPEHKAVVEGDEEVVLTERQTLTMWLNGLPLHLRPRSFFQTNSHVAAALYREAAGWVGEIRPKGMWDLFCGVGGFALHCARHVDGPVTGIEVSAEAIDSARQTAAELGLGNTHFRALQAADFALGQAEVPELVLVNPPRRGIGAALCAFLDASAADWLIYSSCNPASLAHDLARLPSFEPVRARLFDIFPHTSHSEVLVLLRRKTPL